VAASHAISPRGGRSPFIVNTRVLKWALLAFVFVAGFGVRLYRISDPPLDFWPNREFRSYLIARGYYFRSLKSVPQWEREVSETNLQMEGVLEPPIMEHVAAFTYRVTGGERPWIPRVLSSIFWILGGAFVYLIARRWTSIDSAVVSTGFYLLLPYGIIASRSFQPDPLMVMTLLASVYSIVLYSDQPSNLRLVMAGVLAGLGIFIKPMCLFPLFGAFLSLAIFQHGIRNALLNKKTLTFFAIALAPALYYVYGLFIAGFLQSQADNTFMPQLLLHWRFWLAWLAQINRAIGFPAVALALLGFLLLPRGWMRALLVGLGISYFVYGLVFDYHIATHDYYQLPFLPVIALALVPVIDLALEQVARFGRPSFWRTALVGIFLAAGLLALGTARRRLYHAESSTQVRIAEEIGNAVNHSPRNIILGSEYVRPLEYYGEVSVIPWPTSVDFEWERLLGRPIPTAEDQYEDISQNVHPDFFIVRSFTEFDKQRDLRGLLVRRFPVLVQTKDYMIFKLGLGQSPH